MTRKGDAEAPLVENSRQEAERPPDFCQTCARILVVFVIAVVVGLLAGLGFSKGTVAVCITAGVIVLALIVIVIFTGCGNCYRNCKACFDMNRDGRLNCIDFKLLCCGSAPQMIATVGFGVIIGLLIGFLIP